MTYSKFTDEGLEKKPRYADLCKDSGFKTVFGAEDDTAPLVTLLNTFLPEDRKVENVKHFSNSEMQGLAIYSGVTHFDLYCADTSGRKFIVEMQRVPHEGMFKRFLTYACKAYVSNFKKEDKNPETGENKDTIERYAQIPPVFLIAFVLGEFEEKELNQTDGLVSRIGLRDAESEIEIPELLNLIFVRLYKSKSSVSREDSDLDKCCFTLKNAGAFEVCPDGIIDSPYEDFVAKAEIANFGEVKFKEYTAMKQNEEKYIIEIEDSYRRGKLAGKKDGIAEGRAEGRAEGLLEAARRMLALGQSAEFVNQCTGLSIEDVFP